ncbi:TIGR02221 family CRISPR-associated protein [Argonema antarcticum]|uniref:TIGR02221 family CRISPR-associated protein n=1 Tax=Argonema antarcticum TaxID=2942763 RepID=UPI002011F2A9|nr:TIGR02221 family CRISPR-associated protein [Argonema antarcticum]MCL1475013.1 TIGR02221 family CRISPR-associated protein [Argonema antarcticum A004/B2]
MSLKIITFLGAAPATFTTTYAFKDRNGKETKYDGKVFPEALRQFCGEDKYDLMLVCLTEKAKTVNWPVLEALNDPRIQAVDIPTGNNTAEMWQIFTIITGYIERGDRVIFDITHGLRSLPFLVFLFAAYLKTAKQVTIEAIYYGAFDLKSENNGLAPVIDLSEFVSMIDWIAASNQFVETGDARQLSQLLNPNSDKLGANKNAAGSLFNLSLATLLCRPLELGNRADNLVKDLLEAEKQQPNRVVPFELLRQQVNQTFSSFVGNLDNDAKAALQAQFRLIKWYHKNNRIIEAMTLAREWLLSAVNYKLEGSVDIDNRHTREDISDALWDIGQNRPPRELKDEGRKIHKWPEKRQLIAVWHKVRTLRNTLDHAGYERHAPNASKIVQSANQAINSLSELAECWGLGDS